MLKALKNKLIAQTLKLTLKFGVKPVLGSKLPTSLQRKWLNGLSSIPPISTAVADHCLISKISVDSIEAERIICTQPAPSSLKGKVIIYLHGGAFYLGSAKTHRALTSHLSKVTGCTVFVPEYRLAPEHPFPAALEDAMGCFQWLLREGVAAKDIIIAGDSAGGGLAVATALNLVEKNMPVPGALVLFSPWVNLCVPDIALFDDKFDPLLSWNFIRNGASFYLHGNVPNHGDTSHLSAAQNPLTSVINADLRQLPPLLIQYGSLEIFKPDIQQFTQKLEKQKVPYEAHQYENLWHVFQLHAGLMSRSDEAIDEVRQFLKRTLK